MLAPAKSSPLRVPFRPIHGLSRHPLSSFLYFAQCHAFVAYNSCALFHSPLLSFAFGFCNGLQTLSLSLSFSFSSQKRLAFIFGFFYIYAYGRTTVSGASGSGQRTHPWVCEEIKRISAACSLAAAVGSYKRSTGELDELLAREELIDPASTRRHRGTHSLTNFCSFHRTLGVNDSLRGSRRNEEFLRELERCFSREMRFAFEVCLSKYRSKDNKDF